MNKNNQIKLLPSILKGNISAPPSKSVSHRALMAAALSKGTSVISNIAFSEDIIATIGSLKLIGASFEINDNSVTVKGVSKIKTPNSVVDCNESGSTLRFLIPLFSLCNNKVEFTGKPSLLKRPQGIYFDLFNTDQERIKYENSNIVVNGSIKAQNYIVDGSISSQFITGLLYTLPLLEEDSTITIVNKFESKSYVDITIQVLEEFGITIKETSNGYYIEGSQQYKPTNYRIEGDYSQAAFFLTAGILNQAVKVEDLDLDTTQGDREIVDIIQAVNGRIVFMENGYTTTKSELKGTVVDISNCPDLGPIVALLLSFSKGKSKIINAERLRFKESDRIHSTVSTLQALGATIEDKGNEIHIQGKKSLRGGITVDSFNDHRIAMMVTIASSVCELPVILSNANAINKSYPSFYDDYQSLGGRIEEVVVNDTN